ncbi:MAG: acyl transferase [Cyclobacteriaceae bacterium]|nr:acyl transferase [Cyclobacteriaceae bacterium]
MDTFKSFEDSLYSVNEGNFEVIALRLFRFQAQNNPVYHQYLSFLNCNIDEIKSLEKIPFLPIGFFKTKLIKTGAWQAEAEFLSSGTTGITTSQHLVKDISFYTRLSENIFEQFYGPCTNYHFLALLPSYLERKGSSLIVMMNHFINMSKSSHSGFYLTNHKELAHKLQSLKNDKKRVILWGVSFALLDFAESGQIDLSNCIIIETGGMKGRRNELIRRDIHEYLTAQFNVKAIHSEYGMTELMSQAYSEQNGYYQCPPWMKVFVRDINDPFTLVKGRAGAINIIDLANFHSCAFIETQDLGRIDENGNFEVMGRIDNSDSRGCNLLVE